MNFEQKLGDAKGQGDLEAKLEKIKVIPEEKRRLETLGDYGYRWRVREPLPLESESEQTQSHRFTEYFFDFDDTLFDTTGYIEAIFSELEKLGIEKNSSQEIYRGLKIFRPAEFIQRLRDAYPDKKDIIETALNVSNPTDFVKPDMSFLIKKLSAENSARVHILTRGDHDFQLKKVRLVFEMLGVPADVLITELSKAEFLRKFIPEEYPYITDGKFSQSLVVIDDKPEEIEQLIKLRGEIPSLAPIRLRDPVAKYSDKDTNGEKSLEYISHEIRDILAS